MQSKRSGAAHLPSINLRFIYASFHALLSTLVFASFVIFAALFRAPLRCFEWAAHSWSGWILWASAMDVHLSGLENLPPTSAVLVGNHQGMFDILVLLRHIPHPPVFVAKQELFYVPLFGQGLRAVGHIPVDRKNSEKAIASIQKGAKQLAKNQQHVTFFPEGTRTRDGKLLPFKKGAFVFALESGLPIVPFCIRGSYEALPPGVRVVRPGRIDVTFLQPIDPSTYADTNKEELLKQVYALIQTQLEKMEAQESERLKLQG
jgi:1-acyl-sn-glycerol-3-phosphate acyltransferase